MKVSQTRLACIPLALGLCAAMATQPPSVAVPVHHVALGATIDWQAFADSTCSANGTCIVGAPGATCYGRSETLEQGGEIYEVSSCAMNSNPTADETTTNSVQAN